jgi:hypothetical protein
MLIVEGGWYSTVVEYSVQYRRVEDFGCVLFCLPFFIVDCRRYCWNLTPTSHIRDPSVPWNGMLAFLTRVS